MPGSMIGCGLHKHNVCRLLLSSAALLLLTGCPPPPYALDLAEVNEGRGLWHRDAPAAIAISPPQIYAREALINDRRAEQAYLKGLLDRSADPDKTKFTPQLRRELTFLSTIGATLEGKYDPAAINTYTADRRLAEIESRRAILEKEVAIRELEQKLAGGTAPASGTSTTTETATAGSTTASTTTTTMTPGGTGGAAGGTGTGSGPAAPAGAPATGASGTSPAPGGGTASGNDVPADRLRGVLKDLRGQLAELRTQLNTETKLPVEAGVASDPREDFRDRQAYRSDLRAAQAEAQLDDIHDQYGRSLYRLQFRATVLPGRIKDKYGLARLIVYPPEVTYQELKALYNTWLAHSTYRLNVADNTNDTSRSNIRTRDYEQLGASTGLFDVARIYYSTTPGTPLTDLCQAFVTPYEARTAKCGILPVAVPPGQARFLQPVLPELQWLTLKILLRKVTEARLANPNIKLKELMLNNCSLVFLQQPSQDELNRLTLENPRYSRNQFSYPITRLTDIIKSELKTGPFPDNIEGLLTLKRDGRITRRMDLDEAIRFYRAELAQSQARSGRRDYDPWEQSELENLILQWISENLQRITFSGWATIYQSLNETNQISPAEAILQDTSTILTYQEPILVSLNGLVSRRDIDRDLAEKAVYAAAAYEETVQVARNLIEEIERASSCTPGSIMELIHNTGLKVPEDFCRMLSSDRNECTGASTSRIRLGGEPYVYSAQPLGPVRV